ncbi:MAG TPA: hypothetical protein VKB76_12735, partial [Ktedonobacterales bacterium]|nr:hypothetical protein [Ktedonobacterales bacterium]
METEIILMLAPEGEARDPETSGERLTTLAEEPRFAPLVAANPNTPADVLLRLVQRFPRQVVENPVLPLLLIENPQFFKQHERELLPFLRVADVPAFMMNIMRISKDKLARDAARYHVQCGGEAGQDWEQHAQTAIRRRPYHIAKKSTPRLHGQGMVRRFCAVPDVPAWLLTALAAHGADPVRLAVAAYPGTPPELLDFLAKDAHRDVVRQVAEHPQGSPNIFFTHASRWNPLHRTAASHLKLPLQLMEDIVANEADYELRRSLAQNPHLPSHIVACLVHDANPLVRSAIAQRDDLSKADIAHLAGDRDAGVRVAVAVNPRTPISVLEQLASDESSNVR